MMNSYYGSMKPLTSKVMKKKGVWDYMQKEYINQKLESLEEKLTKLLQDGLLHLRKDLIRDSKKHKDLFNILFKVKANKSMKILFDKLEKEKASKNKNKKKISHSSKPEPEDFEDSED